MKKKLYRMQFRKLANDFLNQAGGHDRRIVLFTSAMAKEGTTTVAREFAEELAAQSGKRVSLVDSGKLGGLNRSNLERSLIERLKKEYEYIVIDAPAVLEVPEIGQWLNSADGVYFVIAAEKTRRPVIAKALEIVRRHPAAVLGAVLNQRKYPIPENIYQLLYR